MRPGWAVSTSEEAGGEEGGFREEAGGAAGFREPGEDREDLRPEEEEEEEGEGGGTGSQTKVN